MPRDIEGAAAAKQLLVLDGGVSSEVFVHQSDGLNLVRRMITASAKSKGSRDQGRTRIHLHRSVFTKVCHSRTAWTAETPCPQASQAR